MAAPEPAPRLTGLERGSGSGIGGTLSQSTHLRREDRALTPEQISTAAERYLKPQNMVWVVVGDRAKIEAGIRDLNIGEVQFLDADGNLVE